MFDKTNAANAYAAALPDIRQGQSDKPELDKEPAWKSAFRQTLSEIRDKGFRAYAEEINDRKLEELRQKILASMGLNEGDLENMTPEQRNRIEKMVALEIEKRLSAEDALDDDKSGLSGPAGSLADQVRAAPNGLGAGVLLMQEIDPNDPADTGNDDETG